MEIASFFQAFFFSFFRFNYTYNFTRSLSGSMVLYNTYFATLEKIVLLTLKICRTGPYFLT